MGTLEARKCISESVEKKDRNFKATLYPKQFFVGGYELKLRNKKNLEIYFNQKARLNFRFSIEASPLNGFQSKDISVTFNQLEMISTNKGQNESPAAVSAHLTEKAANSLLAELGDVKNKLIKPSILDRSEQSSDPHKQLIFILAEDPEEKNKEEDVYMKVIVGEIDNRKTFKFDMDDAIDVFNKDIKQLWQLCLTPHWRAIYGMNRTSNLVEQMSDRDWKLYLKHNNLYLKMIEDGDYRYFCFSPNNNATSRIMDRHTRKPQRGEIRANNGERIGERRSIESLGETLAKKPRIDINAGKPPVVSLEELEHVAEKSNQKENVQEKVSVSDKTTDLIRPEDELLTFPPPNVKNEDFDGVIVCYKDLRVLDRLEFMNDSIVNFMIGYFNCYSLSPEMKSRVHFFNTFFYSALSRQVIPNLLVNSIERNQKSVHLDILKANVGRVVKWTKKKDLFEKDFVVVPINEDLHWLLVIIVNPKGAIVDMENEEESRKKDPTYIMFFDPLSGLDSHRRVHMTHYFKAYLSGLYEKTKGPGGKFALPNTSTFDPERVRVVVPQNIATQKNFLDCGPFILHYMENFFTSLKPITIKDCEKMDWKEMFPLCNEMADLMRDKIFNIVNKFSKPEARSRLAKFEMQSRKGLSLEGDRRHRHHSAVYPRPSKRHVEYHMRHYSIRPQFPVVVDDEFFNNPRQTSSMLITQKVRKIEPPYGDFTRFY